MAETQHQIQTMVSMRTRLNFILEALLGCYQRLAI